MNLALSTSLLATIGLSAARNLDGIANAVASGEKETARELSTADAGSKPDGRLFKVKGGIDAGILGFSRNLASTCPDTCSPELCDCVEEFGYAEPCYQQLNAVCTATALSSEGLPVSISDCVVESYVPYYDTVYCPFAACRVQGKSYEECQCESYTDFCGVYQNKSGYESDPKTLLYCSIASCCQANIDDEGRKVCLEGSFQDTVVAITTVSPVADDAEEETYATVEEAEEADGGDVATSDGDVAVESDVESIDLTGEADVEESVEREPAASQKNSGYTLGSAVTIAVGAFVWLVV